MGRRSSKKFRRSGGPSLGMGLTGVFPGGKNRVKTNKAAKSTIGVGQTVKPGGAGNVGGFAAQQPPGPAMDPQQLAAAKSAQETQLLAMQDKFKQQNPNAPKMPMGIGIAGAPANQPQQFQQADDMPTGWAEKFKGRGPMGPQPMGGGGRGKGGQNPTGGKGAMRPSPQSSPQGKTFTGMENERGGNPGGPPGMMARPRPNMSRGNKGGQRPSFGGFGGSKGGRRPSPSMGRPNPSMGRPNPYAGLSGETRMTPGTGMQAPNVTAEVIPNFAAPMMKKAPAFKMRSAHNTTFKEMGSSSKKSAPTRKTSTGYKMPGYGKR